MSDNMGKKTNYFVCVGNEGYPTSLELRKIYESVPDIDSESHGLIRIIDESGEDYLYPRNFFIPIEVSQEITHAFAVAS